MAGRTSTSPRFRLYTMIGNLYNEQGPLSDNGRGPRGEGRISKGLPPNSANEGGVRAPGCGSESARTADSIASDGQKSPQAEVDRDESCVLGAHARSLFVT